MLCAQNSPHPIVSRLLLLLLYKLLNYCSGLADLQREGRSYPNSGAFSLARCTSTIVA